MELAEPVKPRAYNSTLRADQARETRRRIRAAADALFLERGYVEVSMGDIAKAAGVARQTVFTAFGSKSNLLKEVLDVRLAGDDEPLALSERPASQQMVASTDPVDVIRRMAALIVETSARIAPLWPAVSAAVAVDPEMAELRRTYDQGRWEGIGLVVDLVADLGALRKDRTRKKGKDAVWLLTDPAIMFAASALGWSPRELERWYADSLIGLLLDPELPRT